MGANDRQVGGTHYKGGSYQHWDMTVEMLGNRYLEGQATLYVCRWRKKGGVQDLQKAEHFLEKLIEVFKAGKVEPLNLEGRFTYHALRNLQKTYSLTGAETQFMTTVATWGSEAALREALAILKTIMTGAP